MNNYTRYIMSNARQTVCCIGPVRHYARWDVLFLNQLAKEAPQSQTVLKSAASSIRCTERSFSRSAIDLALERTVNRDAASPMRGIVGFHSSHNAIRRWCITSTQRGMSVTELRRLAGLETIEQPAMQTCHDISNY